MDCSEFRVDTGARLCVIILENLSLLTSHPNTFLRCRQTIDGLREWRYGFMPSFVSMFIWIFWCLCVSAKASSAASLDTDLNPPPPIFYFSLNCSYLELWMVPLHIVLVPAYLYFYRSTTRAIITVIKRR